MINTLHCVDHDIDLSMLVGQQYIECCNDGLSKDVLNRFSIRTYQPYDTRYYLIINITHTPAMNILMLQGKISSLAKELVSPSLSIDLDEYISHNIE